MSAKILNIVVPMAGLGSRFSKAGYELPKPLLDVHGSSMIELVIKNLQPSCPHRFIFICQQEHIKQFGLFERLKSMSDNVEVIAIDSITDGAACTVLLAENFINNENPLMIANCDQYVTILMDHYLTSMQNGAYDGYIMTMTADDPKWSYIGFDSNERINTVVEKKVVSSEATVGIYNFKHGQDFVAAAHEMIDADDRVNGEFYVAPVYNYMIRSGANLGYLNIGSDRNGMYGLGTPEDLEYFNALKQLPSK